MAAEEVEGNAEIRVSATVEELLLSALERGEETLQTGRYVITFKEGAVDEGLRSLEAQGLNVSDARDFREQAVRTEDVGDADALLFPEIRSAVVSGAALKSYGVRALEKMPAEGPLETVEPEYFVFADNSEYLRGFISAANTIAKDLGADKGAAREVEDVSVQVLGATWGLARCKVPASSYNGSDIKVAVLDTGLDLGHPDFAGRKIITSTFVGQPVQDLHGHGTHTAGTACGPRAPSGSIPRYGIAYGSQIFVGKVLSNSGSGSTAGVLAGINWAVANRCQVISMSLGSQAPVQAAYTAAGQSALDKGCLIIAAAGNAAAETGAPANSPTIMSVASLDQTLQPSSFSDFGKIEIAAPGRDVFSSVPRPTRYGMKSGTSMAAPHVSGCAALWAQSSPALRGINLWRRLQSSAFILPLPPSRAGSGIVQAP
jgi:subtilisin family serine protease